jgi:hydrogenase maturation protein HypF
MAAGYLDLCYGSDFLQLDLPFVQRLDRDRWRILAQMATRAVNCPPTSSMGRLFDAVGALIGLHDEVIYEGQAAIALERIADRDGQKYPFAIAEGTPFVIDLRPLIGAIVDELHVGVEQPVIAARFHNTVAACLLTACERVRAERGIEIVALSGGVFQNRRLLETLQGMLHTARFRVLLNRRVPANDGGLCFGQAAVAAAQLRADVV